MRAVSAEGLLVGISREEIEALLFAAEFYERKLGRPLPGDAPDETLELLDSAVVALRRSLEAGR